MKVHKCSENPNKINFKSNPFTAMTAAVDGRVMVNKAILDAGIDVPIVIMCNNNEERRERGTRLAIAWVLAFAAPVIILPLANRLAMKHIAKLAPKFSADECKLIRLSNDYLKGAEITKGKTEKEIIKESKELTRTGVKSLGKELGTDFEKAFKNAANSVGGDYEKLRQKLINAKNSVLAFDYLFTAGLLGGVAYFNIWLTKKKTGQDGFAAEFKMADKETVEKRAEAYKKTAWLRKGTFIATTLLLTASPLLIKKGLGANKPGKFNDFIKKHAAQLDYNDGLFMRRLPLFLAAIVGTLGTVSASRNQTELKDSTIRYAALFPAYFIGDLLLNSISGRLSDKLAGTKIINREQPKTLLKRIMPSLKKIKNMDTKSKNVASVLFWVNMAILCSSLGFGLPHLMNKMIKRDVDKDAKTAGTAGKSGFNPATVDVGSSPDLLNDKIIRKLLRA